MRESKRELRRQAAAAQEGIREAREHLEGIRMSIRSIVRDAEHLRVERTVLAAALVALDTGVGAVLISTNGHALVELEAIRARLYGQNNVASRVLIDHDAVRRMAQVA